ncbi:hypothetical protein EJV47_06275 [Hymenobacter gummosus]|uniref:Uncharacterized protein n=1 Tax=Hymenobacter gummosus TaxID=1776032 RepID=A0A3S0HAL4_9BACT|nr:hypothetical protein [Hymenobacter gummosus]RTQ51408.1 hypothetical protein EJV47_06275 [Hymenobacter gummosus]
MNTITAGRHQTRYAAEPHLHLFIDGQPLDGLLHQYYPDDNFRGLVPTLLSWLDRPQERAVVWARARLHSLRRVKLPLLMCPDDLDLSCTVIAAEVIVEDDLVHWPRLGWDATTSHDPVDSCREVTWLPRIPAFAFDRREYQRCLDAFAAALAE